MGRAGVGPGGAGKGGAKRGGVVWGRVRTRKIVRAARRARLGGPRRRSEGVASWAGWYESGWGWAVCVGLLSFAERKQSHWTVDRPRDGARCNRLARGWEHTNEGLWYSVVRRNVIQRIEFTKAQRGEILP